MSKLHFLNNSSVKGKLEPKKCCYSGRKNTKFVCLGYIEPGSLENLSELDRNAMVDECLAYDDVENSRVPKTV
jgi:hypothetical protein